MNLYSCYNGILGVNSSFWKVKGFYCHLERTELRTGQVPDVAVRPGIESDEVLIINTKVYIFRIEG